MSRTAGQLFLKGSVAVGDPDASSLVSRIDVDLQAVRYPQAGILWEATPWLSIGASYRHSFVLNLDQQFRIDGNIGNPGLTPVVTNSYLAVHSVSTDLISAVAAHGRRGAASEATLLVTFDLTFARWSEFPVPAAEPDARARHRRL